MRRVTEVLAVTGEVEFVLVVCASERRDKLPAKDTTEHFDGEEEAFALRTNPALMIRGQATDRHNAVHVRMADQGLPPRVEDAQTPIAAPRCRGLAATSRSVAALA